jgi:hypothetical protein
MIKVEWEFEGDDVGEAAAQAALRMILDRYKRALRGLTCPTHGEVLILRVRGRTLEDLDISVESCCQPLMDEANARIRRASGEVPRVISTDAERTSLREAVQRIHGCPATYRRTERVRETFEGGVAWTGDVAIFDILGHPTAMVCYAWSTQSDASERPRYFAMLKGGAVRSSLDAVRAAMGQAYG